MENATAVEIPRDALRRLEFLSGEYSGTQRLYPPEGKAVSYDAHCCISREACERFLKVEFIADVPDVGIESFTALATYSTSKACYQMWLFASTTEEPLHMAGNFKGRHLVMISDPWSMPWGLQRLRGTFTPMGEDSFEYVVELWEPEGYVVYKRSMFTRRHADV